MEATVTKYEKTVIATAGSKLINLLSQCCAEVMLFRNVSSIGVMCRDKRPSYYHEDSAISARIIEDAQM